MEVAPPVSGEASTEAAACVKVYQMTSYLNKCFALLSKKKKQKKKAITKQEGIALRCSIYSR